MAPRTVQTKIKGVDYILPVMDGDKALRYFGTLTKFLGGPLGRLLTVGLDKAYGQEGEMLANALSELGTHLSSDEFRTFAYAMLEGSYYKTAGSPVPQPLIPEGGNLEIFKGHFAGEIGALLALIWFALRTNYENFSDALPGLSALVRRAQAQLQVQSSPISTMPGSPG